MKRIVLTLAVLAALAVPALASASPSPSEFKNAARYCKALRKDMGADKFREAFGGKRNAFGKCVSQTVKLRRQARRQALEQCKTELSQPAPATGSELGQDPGRGQGLDNAERHRNDKPRGLDRKALRRCVHAKLRAAVKEHHDAIVNAVQVCRAERALGEDAFRTHYGTNENGENAFGKCVSQHVRAGNNPQPDSPPTPQDAPPAT